MPMADVRLYSKSLDQSSHAQVSRGFRDSLRAAGLLAGEYPLDVEPLPEEPPRPGAAASHGVWTGGLAGLPLMRQAGRHGRRWVMVAPNSNRVPPVILKALEAEATDLLVPSAWAQGVMQELTDKLPVSVAPHGIHATMGSSEFATDFLSGEYTDGLGFRVVHFSTSERQRKGTRELIEAWAMLVARKALPEKAMLFLILDLPALNQLIVEYDGEFPYGVMLRQRLELEARSMSGLLRTAHLVCQPSRGEAFGMVPLESLACGTPIVATACTGHSEYLKQDTPGAVVVEHGPYGPIDDWEGAVAPTVSPDAIAVALEMAYKRWYELKTAAVVAAPGVQQRWAWHTVLAPWMEQVRKA
jgi:glycosyltransferase involved in cell wall biosynthesis